jgi:hypothetical protein
MARSSLFFGIIAFLALVAGGCAKNDSLQLVPIENRSDTKSVQPDIEVEPKTTEQILECISNYVLSGTESKYPILLIAPEPGVDFLIVEITPDPTIGYKIRITDPNSGKEIEHPIGDSILEKIMQDQENVVN